MEIKIQKKTIIFLIFLELALLLIFFSFFPKEVFAGVGSPNVTVITNLTVGNVFPELSNVTVENNASTLALTPNTTRRIYCSGLATDYNGWDDVKNASAMFFDNTSSSYNGADDNNLHYTNTSCTITQDGTYTDWINCSFDIWYYANPGIWTCTMILQEKGDMEAIQ
jgi:ABC-type cobalt transport system substrate-binding protein